ncbi:riboflavin biosynthesis protein RibF [Sporocytophaga myxococcoides]|uniref:Riboflavin biosynthesis protein n=1 Tax=Sporocytophaga myxococcoides TaxID=153721 RepID=A0A098LF60_9BACT|nr:bifunctional riboflavin kinase/FAD synthetase [Sporocytophaga myxococcoides]GAL85084.1 riboflavin biosynthesis protein RibF [Sporocytophaga myxococcoides]
MKVYNSFDEFTRLPNAIVTIGTFDGVHLGHRKILSRLKETSNEEKGESVVITFWPHPRKVLQGADSFKLLLTLEEKIELIASCGVDHLLLIPFTKEFSSTTSEDFIQKILIDKIGTKKLVIGYDHKFGKNREGSFEYLKENASRIGFQVEEIPREDIEHNAISSTAIREALSQNNVSKATTLLGRPYSIKGKVVEGNKLGRELGYPTANIEVEDPEKILPADGIYTVFVKEAGKLYGGMLSLGFNPTVEGKGRSMEVHIFDFNKNIYGETVEVSFLEFLRFEAKFPDLDALIHQLKEDEKQSRAILENYNKTYHNS